MKPYPLSSLNHFTVPWAISWSPPFFSWAPLKDATHLRLPHHYSKKGRSPEGTPAWHTFNIPPQKPRRPCVIDQGPLGPSPRDAQGLPRLLGAWNLIRAYPAQAAWRAQ